MYLCFRNSSIGGRKLGSRYSQVIGVVCKFELLSQADAMWLPLQLYLMHVISLLNLCRLSDFAQMWLRSRLKQWPNHFSLLFSRNVSTGFTCASFLMSSFLMWSNLVFPLAHLNILISAEFSLFSSFFSVASMMLIFIYIFSGYTYYV